MLYSFIIIINIIIIFRSSAYYGIEQSVSSDTFVTNKSTSKPPLKRSTKNSSGNQEEDYLNDAMMDLHTFPTAVARAAVMHVLGEMCIGKISIGMI